MNWGRIKTVLIVMFVIINLMLLGLLYHHYLQGRILTDETIQTAVNALEKNGVMLGPDLVPKKMSKMRNITLVNIISSYDDFARQILGDGYQQTDGVYQNGGKTLSIKGNTFTITDKTQSVNSEKEAQEWLKDMGFDMEYAVVEEREDGFLFYQAYKGYEIFESHVIVTAKEGGPCTASGMWMTPKKEKQAAYETKPITSLLPKIVKEKEAGETLHITGLTLGYSEIVSRGDTEFYSEATAVPMWKVETQEGKTFYFDSGK